MGKDRRVDFHVIIKGEMTKTVDISELKNSIQAVIALTKGGDEVVLEENGEPVVKVTPISDVQQTSTKQRVRLRQR